MVQWNQESKLHTFTNDNDDNNDKKPSGRGVFGFKRQTDNQKNRKDREEKNDKWLSDINEETSVNGLAYKGNSDPPMIKKQHSELYHRFDDLYHNEANTRFLFANPDGYAAIDGGIKGGYLIQATKHVFCKLDQIYQKNLDNIVNQIRLETRKLVGSGTMQNVEDVNRINFNVLFQKGTRK